VLRAVLLDIEGTASPVEFVYKVLFPYAEERLRDFMLAHYESPEICQIVTGLFKEYEHEHEAAPAWFVEEDMEGAISYLEWLIEKDRKSTGLKAVQGLIWKSGFESGQIKGEVYPDVPAALEHWTQAGLKVYIFSSGSVLAQTLLFRHSTAGDLGQFLSGYFDTQTGPKRESGSYLAIAAAVGIDPGEILFVSDVLEELTAAHDAGMDVRLAVRPGNKAVTAHSFEVLRSFDELF